MFVCLRTKDRFLQTYECKCLKHCAYFYGYGLPSYLLCILGHAVLSIFLTVPVDTMLTKLQSFKIYTCENDCRLGHR